MVYHRGFADGTRTQPEPDCIIKKLDVFWIQRVSWPYSEYFHENITCKDTQTNNCTAKPWLRLILMFYLYVTDACRNGLFAQRVVANKKYIDCISVGEQFDCVQWAQHTSGIPHVRKALTILLNFNWIGHIECKIRAANALICLLCPGSVRHPCFVIHTLCKWELLKH